MIGGVLGGLILITIIVLVVIILYRYFNRLRKVTAQTCYVQYNYKCIVMYTYIVTLGKRTFNVNFTYM